MEPLLNIFLACCALSASMAGYGALVLVNSASDEARVRQRLRLIASDGNRASRQAAEDGPLAKLKNVLLKKVSAAFGHDGVKSKDKLRAKLIAAGIYSPEATRSFIAARVVLLMVGGGFGLLLSLAAGYDWTLCLAGGGGAGYMLPVFWLRMQTKKNHVALMKGLPDGLDLMVVCVEAGLTIDAAMKRVGDELALAHPAIAREFSICHMETQIGLPRAQALKNLGARSNYSPLKALCAMLAQAERFGTSIAQALRVQSDGLRAQRQVRAEEAAGKASVKLTFPLVLFIFPSSFIVLMGPTILRMLETGMF